VILFRAEMQALEELQPRIGDFIPEVRCAGPAAGWEIVSTFDLSSPVPIHVFAVQVLVHPMLHQFQYRALHRPRQPSPAPCGASLNGARSRHDPGLPHGLPGAAPHRAPWR
jgi:hypothetical protein